MSEARAGLVVGRYQLDEPIAAGGMATVYMGRVLGPRGFARTVAVKRLHPHLASQPAFAAMLMDEAQLAARVRHPNVVPILDVVEADDELLLVMEYVHGVSLARLTRELGARSERVPFAIAAYLVAGVCHGLHAAHEARDESGAPLDVIHRDVSPQNILVGSDGLARITDFGIAKAVRRVQDTGSGELKGKIGYMAPEQLSGKVLDRRVDVFAAGIVLWELLTGERLFRADADAAVILTKMLFEELPSPSQRRTDIPPALESIVVRALTRDPAGRFSTALEMALALERVFGPQSAVDVGAWLRSSCRALDESAARLERVEGRGAGEEATTGIVPTEVDSMGPTNLVEAGLPRPPVETHGLTTNGAGTVTLDARRTVRTTRSRRLVVGSVAALLVVVGVGGGSLFLRRGATERAEAPRLAMTPPPTVDEVPSAETASPPPRDPLPAPSPSSARSAARPSAEPKARRPHVATTTTRPAPSVSTSESPLLHDIPAVRTLPPASGR